MIMISLCVYSTLLYSIHTCAVSVVLMTFQHTQIKIVTLNSDYDNESDMRPVNYRHMCVTRPGISVKVANFESLSRRESVTLSLVHQFSY